MNAIDVALLPGAFLVDALPIRTCSGKKVLPKLKVLTIFVPTVKYVPEWFPGAGFKTFARNAKKNLDHSVNYPFKHVKESFEVRGDLPRFSLSCA